LGLIQLLSWHFGSLTPGWLLCCGSENSAVSLEFSESLVSIDWSLGHCQVDRVCTEKSLDRLPYMESHGHMTVLCWSHDLMSEAGILLGMYFISEMNNYKINNKINNNNE
jgi:hypothetical protein